MPFVCVWEGGAIPCQTCDCVPGMNNNRGSDSVPVCALCVSFHHPVAAVHTECHPQTLQSGENNTRYKAETMRF